MQISNEEPEEYIPINFIVPPGEHVISLNYEYNRFGVNANRLGPYPEGVEGVVWIDNVWIEEYGV